MKALKELSEKREEILKEIEEVKDMRKMYPQEHVNYHRFLELEAKLQTHDELVKLFENYLRRLKEEVLQEIFNEWEIDEDVIKWVFKEIDKLSINNPLNQERSKTGDNKDSNESFVFVSSAPELSINSPQNLEELHTANAVDEGSKLLKTADTDNSPTEKGK